MKKKYFTEEEKKAAEKAQRAKRYQENRNEVLALRSEYRSTTIGRANYLLNAYRQLDKKYNRGECTLTVEFILEHIFTQPCTHCGETDWHKLGVNRLDNNLPHTPDNVEPCCWKCNIRLQSKENSKTVYQYTLDGELVKIWPSATECGRNGFYQGHITDCCNGKRKSHKGYRWSYEPL